MSVSINIVCFVIGVIFFGVGVKTFTSDSLFFAVFGFVLLLISLSLCFGAFFDVREKNAPNQSTQYSQVQEETTATYNAQNTTEPCTCSNYLKERTTVATTTEPNTKCTCSRCVGQ